MRKTIDTRILEATAKTGKFDRRSAHKSFPGYTREEIHNSVMRRARALSSEGLLRNSDGVFTLTKKGRSIM